MLQVRTEEQLRHIASILGVDFNAISISKYPLSIMVLGKGQPISFDQMAEIVSYLRMCHRILWMKIKANLAGQKVDYYYQDSTIFLKNRNTNEQNESFILSLAEFGYDTEELLNEYKKTGKITI